MVVRVLISGNAVFRCNQGRPFLKSPIRCTIITNSIGSRIGGSLGPVDSRQTRGLISVPPMDMPEGNKAHEVRSMEHRSPQGTAEMESPD